MYSHLQNVFYLDRQYPWRDMLSYMPVQITRELREYGLLRISHLTFDREKQNGAARKVRAEYIWINLTSPKH